MFLHHTMTDHEIIRSCEGCESQHLRLVADRLADRVALLDRIARKYPQFGRFKTTRDYVRQYYELNKIDGSNDYGLIIDAFFEPLPNRPFPQNVGPDGLMELIEE